MMHFCTLRARTHLLSPKLRQAFEVIVFLVTVIRIVTQRSSSLTAVSGEERCVTTLRIPLQSPQHSFIIEPAVPSARLFIFFRNCILVTCNACAKERLRWLGDTFVIPFLFESQCFIHSFPSPQVFLVLFLRCRNRQKCQIYLMNLKMSAK